MEVNSCQNKISYKKWLDISRKKAIQQGAELSVPLILLQFVTQKTKLEIIKDSSPFLSLKEVELLNTLYARYLQNEPLAYLLQVKEFYGRDFFVSSDVLIPRPETELIIDIAKEYFEKRENKEVLNICDIGTGSGCLGITLLMELENSSCTAYDISEKALGIAKKNAEFLLKKKNSLFLNHTGIKNADRKQKFDCIVSNPPYIPYAEYIGLEESVKNYEPKIALTSGNTGLEIIEEVLSFAHSTLKPQGLLLIEHGYNQANSVLNLARQYKEFSHIESKKDYAGKWRILKAIKEI